MKNMCLISENLCKETIVMRKILVTMMAFALTIGA